MLNRSSFLGVQIQKGFNKACTSSLSAKKKIRALQTSLYFGSCFYYTAKKFVREVSGNKLCLIRNTNTGYWTIFTVPDERVYKVITGTVGYYSGNTKYQPLDSPGVRRVLAETLYEFLQDQESLRKELSKF